MCWQGPAPWPGSALEASDWHLYQVQPRDLEMGQRLLGEDGVDRALPPPAAS